MHSSSSWKGKPWVIKSSGSFLAALQIYTSFSYANLFLKMQNNIAIFVNVYKSMYHCLWALWKENIVCGWRRRRNLLCIDEKGPCPIFYWNIWEYKLWNYLLSNDCWLVSFFFLFLAGIPSTGYNSKQALLHFLSTFSIFAPFINQSSLSSRRIQRMLLSMRSIKKRKVNVSV